MRFQIGDFERKEATSLLVNELTGCFIRCKFCMIKTSWTSISAGSEKEKLPAHPVRTGQARRSFPAL